MRNWFNSIQTSPRLGEIMRPEDNSFGVMRLLMAVAVLISHSYLFQYGSSTGEPLTAWTSRSLGEHGVQVFFILSGLMVAQSFERSRGIIDFTTARVLRIFPALIVCVLLTSLLFAPLLSRFDLATYFTHPELALYIAKTVSLATGSAPLPGVFEQTPLPGLFNMSLWTLKYEVICYVALGIVGMAGVFHSAYRVVATVAVALFIGLVFIVSPEDHHAYSLFDNIRYFSVFFATGILAYLLRDKLPVHGALLVPLFAFFILTIDTAVSEPAAALFLGYGAIWLSSFTFGPMRAFCNRYDLSFGIYIYAGPFQQAMIDRWHDFSPAGVSMLTAAIVVPLAFLSWTLVERPAMLQRRAVVDFVSNLIERGLALLSSRTPATVPVMQNMSRIKVALRSDTTPPQRDDIDGRRPRLKVI